MPDNERSGDVRAVPKPSQVERPATIEPGEKTPFGGYLCPRCGAVIVMHPDQVCMPCREEWTT